LIARSIGLSKERLSNIRARGPTGNPDAITPELHIGTPASDRRVAKERHKRLTYMVRTAGLEPALPYEKQILSLLRLPFRHVRFGRPARRNVRVRAAASR
jgi:hypothetical protein